MTEPTVKVRSSGESATSCLRHAGVRTLRKQTGCLVDGKSANFHRRAILQLLATGTGALLGLSGCAPPSIALRYRLKISVRLRGQLYEASSVVETLVQDRGDDRLGDLPRFVVSGTKGEAIIVDLPEHGTAFGLLHPPEGSSFGFSASSAHRILAEFLTQYQWQDRRNHLRYIQELRGEFELPKDDRPVVVRFLDLADPNSVLLLDLDLVAEQYRATISITGDAPETGKIDTKLPWLRTSRTNLVSKLKRGFQPIDQLPLAERISPRSFSSDGAKR